MGQDYSEKPASPSSSTMNGVSGDTSPEMGCMECQERKIEDAHASVQAHLRVFTLALTSGDVNQIQREKYHLLQACNAHMSTLAVLIETCKLTELLRPTKEQLI